MSEDINKILELTTNEVGEIIIDYIDKNGITKEWEYSSDKEILNHITNLQEQIEIKNEGFKATVEELCETSEKLERLKQENERLKEKYKSSQITLAEEWKKRIEIEENNKHLDNQITMLKQQNNAITEMGLDYKSRNEKAIDVLEELIAEFQLNDYITDFDKKMNKPLNILQGSDK